MFNREKCLKKGIIDVVEKDKRPINLKQMKQKFHFNLFTFYALTMTQHNCNVEKKKISFISNKRFLRIFKSKIELFLCSVKHI